jgi:hypothetical protein
VPIWMLIAFWTAQNLHQYVEKKAPEELLLRNSS